MTTYLKLVYCILTCLTLDSVSAFNAYAVLTLIVIISILDSVPALLCYVRILTVFWLALFQIQYQPYVCYDSILTVFGLLWFGLLFGIMTKFSFTRKLLLRVSY